MALSPSRPRATQPRSGRSPWPLRRVEVREPQMSAVSRWQEKNIQLEFRLGGFRLTRATFRGLVAKHGLGTAIDSAIPNLLPDFDVAVILGYPSSNLVGRCDGFRHVFPYIPYHYERYYV